MPDGADQMKNIAIIPARGGSKRLPGKNLLALGDIPLIAYSILYARSNPEIIGEVYVSTDDDQIKAVSINYGAKVIERPAAISGDQEPTVSALRHVLEQVGPVDNVFLLQPTNPLRPAALLTDAFRIYLEKRCESLFTVSQSHKKLGRIVGDKFQPFNYTAGMRSQDMEPLYFENGLLYIVSQSVIRTNTIISEDAFPMIVEHPYADVDIDTESDFAYATYLYNSKNAK